MNTADPQLLRVETVGDLPVLWATLQRLDLPALLDRHFPTPVHRRGQVQPLEGGPQHGGVADSFYTQQVGFRKGHSFSLPFFCIPENHPKYERTVGYILEMHSKEFDAFLRLEDPQGKMLAENDDVQPGVILNARILFTAPQSGTYQVVATAFQQRGSGAYTLLICEFVGKK